MVRPAFQAVAAFIVTMALTAVTCALVWPAPASAAGRAVEQASVSSTGAQPAGRSQTGVVSRNGRYVTFLSYAAFDSRVNPNVPYPSVYLRDRVAGTTRLVSLSYRAGIAAQGSMAPMGVSDDGRYVLISGNADLADPGDGMSHVYLRDMSTGAIGRIDVSDSGALANRSSSAHAMTPDGRHVVFTSEGSNLVANDTNGFADAFVRDLVAGTTRRVSLSNSGAQANYTASASSVSDDGRFIVFESPASNLVPGDTNSGCPGACGTGGDVFVRDLAAGTTTRVSVASDGSQGNDSGGRQSGAGMITADGRYVAFTSGATNLAPGDTNGAFDCFLHDRAATTTTRVSVAPGGGQLPRGCATVEVSGDGSVVLFTADDAAAAPGFPTGMRLVVRRHLATGTNEVATVDAAGEATTGHILTAGSISGDGRSFAYETTQPLLPADADSDWDVYVVRFDPVDSTPPKVTGHPDRDANPDGWYSAPVTVSWSAIDPEPSAGAPTTPPDNLVSTEGAGQAVTSAPSCDPAGNCATGTYKPLNIDLTAPAITPTVSPAANGNGWHSTAVTVTFACADALSGIAGCPGPVVVTDDGTAQAASGTTADRAGHTATTTVTGINIDRSAPRLGAPTWTVNPKPVGSTSAPVSTTLSVPATDVLSGVQGGEYFIGADPGLGGGSPMSYTNGSLSAALGAGLAVGVYDIGVRGKDAANNWSLVTKAILVVYDPAAPGMTGRNNHDLTPSLARGDVLPGLTDPNQTDTADYGFTIEYRNGTLEPHNDFHLRYATGTRCNSPNAVNCHQLTLDTTDFQWLITDGTNNSRGRFQGTARVTVDGLTTTNPFTFEGIDGDRLTPNTDDHITVKIYPPQADPATTSPIYRTSGPITRGNAIRIR